MVLKTKWLRRGLLGTAVASPLAAIRPAGAEAPGLSATSFTTQPGDTVPAAHARDLVVRWGDRVTPDARAWNPRNPSAAAAETQFGWDGLLLGLFSPPTGADGVPRGILAVAHPTVDPAMAFPGGVDRPAVAAVMQGASLINVEFQRERWVVSEGGYQSRRLTANTLCRISGRAAATVGEAVRGLLHVSGGCWTPWGSLLLAEGDPTAWAARLREAEPRLAETGGFGWVAELDGTEPTSLPVKRTALGRFGHGGVAAALTRDGRAVVYMTDRRPGGFLFRFVSDGAALSQNALDAGTLSVARVEGEMLRWIDLPRDAGTLADPTGTAARFGAAAFQHPSGLDVDRRDDTLFLACHGSPGTRPAVPGYVLQLSPRAHDHGADTAALSVVVQGGPAPRGPVQGGVPVNHPDTVAADGTGRIWIGTDRGGRIGPVPDLLFVCDTTGPRRGVPIPFYAAPRGAAIGGAAVSPDGTALFAMVRTPGAEPGASWDRPGTTWPAFDAAVPPRTALVTFSRLRGGRVGT